MRKQQWRLQPRYEIKNTNNPYSQGIKDKRRLQQQMRTVSIATTIAAKGWPVSMAPVYRKPRQNVNPHKDGPFVVLMQNGQKYAVFLLSSCPYISQDITLNLIIFENVQEVLAEEEIKKLILDQNK